MIEGYSSECPLCRLAQDGEILTHLLLETEHFIVVDCLLCKVPMAVLKAHRPDFSDSERVEVRKLFREILASDPLPLALDAVEHLREANLLVSDDRHRIPWVVDWEQRRIPDHPHCHLRPRPFPGTERWELLINDC